MACCLALLYVWALLRRAVTATRTASRRGAPGADPPRFAPPARRAVHRPAPARTAA